MLSVGAGTKGGKQRGAGGEYRGGQKTRVVCVTQWEGGQEKQMNDGCKFGRATCSLFQNQTGNWSHDRSHGVSWSDSRDFHLLLPAWCLSHTKWPRLNYGSSLPFVMAQYALIKMNWRQPFKIRARNQGGGDILRQHDSRLEFWKRLIVIKLGDANYNTFSAQLLKVSKVH